MSLTSYQTAPPCNVMEGETLGAEDSLSTAIFFQEQFALASHGADLCSRPLCHLTEPNITINQSITDDRKAALRPACVTVKIHRSP